jgi:hypothetical protein
MKHHIVVERDIRRDVLHGDVLLPLGSAYDLGIITPDQGKDTHMWINRRNWVVLSGNDLDAHARSFKMVEGLPKS